MRTTLTLDDDVAAALERLRRTRRGRFRDLVNEALREGLKGLTAPPRKRLRFRTRVVDLGRCRLANEHGLTLCSTDGDCGRFPVLHRRDPLAV